MGLNSSPFHGFSGVHCRNAADLVTELRRLSLRAILHKHSPACGGLKISRILKFVRKFYITLAGIKLHTAPILHTSFKLGEGLGCEGVLGHFFSPKKVKGSPEEKEKPHVDFRQVV